MDEVDRAVGRDVEVVGEAAAAPNDLGVGVGLDSVVVSSPAVRRRLRGSSGVSRDASGKDESVRPRLSGMGKREAGSTIGGRE